MARNDGGIAQDGALLKVPPQANKTVRVGDGAHIKTPPPPPASKPGK